jgi:tRNA(Ile)-lysidine synthase
VQQLTALPVPERALVDRFKADLAAVWPEGARGAEASLGLAVSGGGDSLALLLLAHAALPGRVAVATVDHGLRAASAVEAVEVAAVCARLGVPHTTLAVQLAPGNLQAEARAARYAALGEWAMAQGLAALATAHHADDQAETLLARLNRASGVAGLAGVRARGLVPGVAKPKRLPLLRPLLGWRRAALAGMVGAAGLVAVNDPSNMDPRFERARLRAALVGADWLDVPALAQSAAHLADADAALDWAAGREWVEAVCREPLGFSYRPQAPRAVALRVLRRIAAELGEEPRGASLARAFDALVRGEVASIGALVARPGPQGWSVQAAPKRRS